MLYKRSIFKIGVHRRGWNMLCSRCIFSKVCRFNPQGVIRGGGDDTIRRCWWQRSEVSSPVIVVVDISGGGNLTSSHSLQFILTELHLLTESSLVGPTFHKRTSCTTWVSCTHHATPHHRSAQRSGYFQTLRHHSLVLLPVQDGWETDILQQSGMFSSEWCGWEENIRCFEGRVEVMRINIIKIFLTTYILMRQV